MDINELIYEYNEYIRKVPNGSLFIANAFREEKIGEALNAINNFSEGMLWLSHISNNLSQASVQVSLNIQKIQEYLIQVNEGLIKQDYVLVADMFEYEIAPFFDEIISAEARE